MEASKHCSHRVRDWRAVCQRLRELLKALGRINRSTGWEKKRAILREPVGTEMLVVSLGQGPRLRTQSRPCQSCLFQLRARLAFPDSL